MSLYAAKPRVFHQWAEWYSWQISLNQQTPLFLNGFSFCNIQYYAAHRFEFLIVARPLRNPRKNWYIRLQTSHSGSYTKQRIESYYRFVRLSSTCTSNRAYQQLYYYEVVLVYSFFIERAVNLHSNGSGWLEWRGQIIIIRDGLKVNAIRCLRRLTSLNPRRSCQKVPRHYHWNPGPFLF